GTQPLADPLNAQTTVILHMQEGVMVGAERPELLPSFTLPSSWYARRRTLVSIGFLLMVFLTLFVQSGLADGALQSLNQSFSLLSNYHTSDIKASVHPLPLTASKSIVRVDSAAGNQYYNNYQWN